MAHSETPSFTDLGLRHEIVEVLARKGIHSPFPVQELTIPDALAGRDVCGKAKTGSGKTLAFGLSGAAVHAPSQTQVPDRTGPGSYQGTGQPGA